MAAPRDELAFDPEVARAAADRFARRAPDRARKQEAASRGDFTAADSRERLAKRVNRLIGKVRHGVAAYADAREAPGLIETLAERDRPLGPEDIDSVLVERVIGQTRDFLSVEFLAQGLAAARSVGRVVTRLGDGRSSFGTGFLVSPRLLMTNQHVLRTPEAAARSAVEFNYQLDRSGRAGDVHRFDLDPDSFFLSDGTLDFALVAVERRSDRGGPLAAFGHCPLIAEEGKITPGEFINIVQHPKGEPKQIVLRENKLLDLPEDLDNFAHYEADTEPGSSGSPVFNDQWEVVALHHSGVPRTDAKGRILDGDGKPWRKGDDPARIGWIANEGIRTSRLVRFIAAAELSTEAERRLRDEVVAARRPPAALDNPLPAPRDARRPETAEDPVRAGEIEVDGRGGDVTVTVPLRITVSLGGPPSRAARRGPSARGLDGMGPDHMGPDDVGRDDVGRDDVGREVSPDRDYANRPGYDRRFLGFEVPLPRPVGALERDAATVEGGGHELRYHHFSVVLNARRRLAFVAAVNLDADPAFVHVREGRDRWFFDPRVPREAQAGEEFYVANDLDRGHLARRADAAWGETAEEARLANDDTFHFTNCSPQHQVFNQSDRATRRGLLLWGNLENHVAAQARADNRRLSILNGPVFRADDREHRGLAIPREYYKVVVFESDSGEPRAAAFVMSQAGLIRNLPEEDFEAGSFSLFQVRVSDLQDRTGLDFADLSRWDPLEGDGAEEAFLEGTRAVPIAALRDVVL